MDKGYLFGYRGRAQRAVWNKGALLRRKKPVEEDRVSKYLKLYSLAHKFPNSASKQRSLVVHP